MRSQKPSLVPKYRESRRSYSGVQRRSPFFMLLRCGSGMPVARAMAFCVWGDSSRTSASVSAKLLTIVSVLIRLVIIGDFYLFGIAFIPEKAKPPLIVDADTVLAHTFPAQGLKPIARRDAQVVKCHGVVELVELHDRPTGNLARKAFRYFALKDLLGLLAFEALNQAVSLSI